MKSFGDTREGRFSLTQLLEGTISRNELVVTFIAVLEMIKLGLLKIRGEEATEAEAAGRLPVIWVELTGKEAPFEIVDDYR